MDAQARTRGVSFGELFTEASTTARIVDTDFLLLTILSVIIFLLVFTLVLVFAIRYRRGSRARRGALPSVVTREVEIGWTSATVFLAIFIFWWGVAAPASFPQSAPHPLEIHIYAKQWMWKAEHPNGAREINTLHLPENAPIRLIMISQDVIHSFYVPAFRVKHDVLPGRIVEMEFQPTRVGSFHLFCAEYCGAEHSNMTGEIIVLPQDEYARWRDAQPHSDSLAAEGAALFHALGCSGCHDPASAVHAPDLRGLFGHEVPLEGGRFAVVDEAYIRDCILMPQKNIPSGYAPIMPSFANVVDDGQIERLIAYIKSLQEPG